jgi:hypothetical protein
LKSSNVAEGRKILESIAISNGKVRFLEHSPVLTSEESNLDTLSPRDDTVTGEETSRRRTSDPNEEDDEWNLTGDDHADASTFLSVDDSGQLGVYGPSSLFSGGNRTRTGRHAASTEQVKNQLFANAALQRQKEHSLRYLEVIRGIPGELALHLLDLHWNRQHHTYLLTYRPALMRELVSGGPYCTDFLLNAVFACSSKYSERIEVREDPQDPESAGGQFFRRCEELLSERALLMQSSVPTIIGLLMLGSTFNARGKTSKGWLYTGYALRMVYDLGLHLDRGDVSEKPEEVEIHRRVFW